MNEKSSGLEGQHQNGERDSALLDRARQSLQGKRGAKYWRSLEQLAETEEFRELLHREFPRHASEWDTNFDRRRFLQLSSASLALAGLTACTKQPPEKIIPYVQQPEHIVPGKPLYFATTLNHAGYGMGLLAESHMGRPTKVEGNPEHPASLGASDLFAQASVLDLYDPDRSRSVTHLGQILNWDTFTTQLVSNRTALEALGGEGLRILTGTVTSPTLKGLMAELQAKMPQAKWHQYEASSSDAARQSARDAFGESMAIRYDLSKADVVVAIDADFLTQGPGAIRYAKDFAKRRRVHHKDDAKKGMSRLYAVDSLPNNTTTVADHRLALSPAEVDQFVLALAARFGVAGATAPSAFASGEHAEWLNALVSDLEAHRGSGLVIAGEYCDAAVHTLVLAINESLGNLGSTVLVTDPVEAMPNDDSGAVAQAESLAELVEAMRSGSVDTLLVLGGANPVYTAPSDLDFAAAMQNVRLRIHHGLYQDETAEYCHWHIPANHYLECWGDALAFDGTVSVGQPLIMPLYEGKNEAQVIAAFLGRSAATDEDLLKAHWEARWQETGTNAVSFERFWRKALHDGLVAGTAHEPKIVTIQSAAVGQAAAKVAQRQSGGLEILFRPDPTVFDGRFNNNGWLQECPKPLTRLTWDNALLMSPRTARDKGLGDLVKGNDQEAEAPLVELKVGDRSLTLPVWVLPGLADNTLVLHLGYGRRRVGTIGAGTGFDANLVRGAEELWRVSEGVDFGRVSGTYLLASTQDHHSMEGRGLVQAAVYDSEHKKVQFGYHPHDVSDLTLMTGDDFSYEGRYAWGMTIDLSACNGCNACVVACQSENNIPSVGKDQVSKGREMHWIRIDRYFSGDADDITAVLNQPVNCMHCEQAPCEVVCPVAATVHSDEGLNDMVYNRCVGTRYCSNNCPYKVRRFNFLLYADFETPELQLGRNPDVTVRSRGVMEKCTYCVQRINHARIDAKREGRKIRDGEIKTACQQACPSDALTFGDVNNPDSVVSKTKTSKLNYNLLNDLGTRPRTTYLARVRNPNPMLETIPAYDDHGDGHHGEAGSGHDGAEEATHG